MPSPFCRRRRRRRPTQQCGPVLQSRPQHAGLTLAHAGWRLQPGCCGSDLGGTPGGVCEPGGACTPGCRGGTLGVLGAPGCPCTAGCCGGRDVAEPWCVACCRLSLHGRLLRLTRPWRSARYVGCALLPGRACPLALRIQALPVRPARLLRSRRILNIVLPLRSIADYSAAAGRSGVAGRADPSGSAGSD